MRLLVLAAALRVSTSPATLEVSREVQRVRQANATQEVVTPCADTLQRSCFGQALAPPEEAAQGQLLAKFHRAMEDSGTEYSIGNGILLGLYRSGQRIPWDDDLDVLLPNAALHQCGCQHTNTKCAASCSPTDTLSPRAMQALAQQGLVLSAWADFAVKGRPFFKVTSTSGAKWPFVDVFFDVPYGAGGLCTACFPTRLVAFRNVGAVRAPLDGRVGPALTTFFGSTPAQLLTTCADNCFSHCRGYEQVCSCQPTPCTEAYARFLGGEPAPWAPTLEKLQGTVKELEAAPPLVEARPPPAQDFVSADVLAHLIIAILVMSVGAVFWVERGNLVAATASELLATASVGLYLATTVACDIFIQLFWQGDSFGFHPQVLVCLCEVLKLTVCVVLAVLSGAKTNAQELMRIGQGMFWPALCFLYLNLLRFYALSQVHLGEYRVWRATDVLFTSALWFVCFNRTVTALQLGGIGLVFAACVMLSFDHNTQVGWMTLVVLSMAFASSLGLVANERGFRTGGYFLVQNACLYVWTSLLGVMVVVGTVPAGHYFQGVHGMVWTYVCLEVCMGLCVAIVLKYANAVIKSLASPWLTPLELVLGHYHVGTPLTIYTVIAALFAGVGNLCYRMGSASPQPAKLPAAEEVPGKQV